MAFVPPLNLEYWFVTVLAGNMGIFLALALLVIAGLAAYFKMPNSVTFASFILFVIVMGARAGELYVVGIVMLAFGAMWALARYFTR